MIHKYKHIPTKPLKRLALFAMLVGLCAASPAMTNNVFAGGKPDGQGNVVASVCYNPSWRPGNPGSPIQRLGIESTRQACRDQGLTVIEPGQAMPVGACLVGENIQYYGDTGNGTQSQGCESTGGTVIRAGDPLPTFTVKESAADNGSGNQQSGGGNEDKTLEDPDKNSTTRDTCGEGNGKVDIAIDVGCKGKGNPILDMLFAFIRFLSIGVGLVLIGSMIVAGIQYTSSRGDPQATAAAIKRITSTVGALALFIFMYAILNWLIPAGLLR